MGCGLGRGDDNPETVSGPAVDAAAEVAAAFNVAWHPAALEVFPGIANDAVYGVAQATVTAAVEGHLAAANGINPTGADTAGLHATAVAGITGGAKVCYSYGVDAAGGHTNAAAPGPYGHPHPRGVAQYAGRGWLARMNTPAGAWNALQPDPFPNAAAAVGGGDLAFGWESGGGYEGVLRGNPAGSITTSA